LYLQFNMRAHKLILSLFVVPLFSLSGCTTSLQELHKISPKAGNFSSSLAAEYLAYSESEDEQGHKDSAEYFASKGVDAIKGKAVEPDAVDIKANNYKTLVLSRLALIDVLNDDVKRIAPQKAARAQMLFDCWNYQENTNTKKSNRLSVMSVSCAEEFNLVYSELQPVADNLLHGAYSKHTLQFAMNSALLDDAAKKIIAEIAKHIEGHSDYALEFNAHHDVNDKKTSQGRLVNERLAAVRRSFIKAGVPSEKFFFTKPDIAKESGSAVLLSNELDMQYSDELDIVMTSARNTAARDK
jgi:outer membrane protein OmpA-like peptidoglycan-associated protein